MGDKIHAPHTWIMMKHHILQSNHMHFHWNSVSNLRNKNVMEVRLIVNMLFKWHYVEAHAHIGAKWIIICLESYM